MAGLAEPMGSSLRSWASPLRKQSSQQFGRLRRIALRHAGTDVTATPLIRRAMIHLNRAWEDLARHAPRVAETLDLFYFGGFDVTAVATTLQRSPEQCAQTLRFGQAWLTRALRPDNRDLVKDPTQSLAGRAFERRPL